MVAVILCFLCVCPSYAQQEEKLTVTTYYPSPTGVYNQLQAKRVVIGDVNADGQINSADVPATARPLFVQGSTTAITTAGFANPAGYGVGIGSADGLTVGVIQSHFYQNGVSSGPAPNLTINLGGGNVGIGTASPLGKLHVAGGVRANKGNTVTFDTSNVGYSFEADGDTGMFAVDGTSNQNSDLIFKIDAMERMRINDSMGFIGIGTANPVTRLHVSGDSDVAARITSTHTGMTGSPSMYMGMNAGNDAGLIELTAGKDFKLWNGQYALTVNGTSGNVGIGTTAPTKTLSVQGNVTITENLTVEGYLETGCYFKTDCPTGASVRTCSCNAGEVLHSGGCMTNDGSALRMSRPVSLIQWRCDAQGTAQVSDFNIICCKQH